MTTEHHALNLILPNYALLNYSLWETSTTNGPYHGRKNDGWDGTQEGMPGTTNEAKDCEDDGEGQEMIPDRTNGSSSNDRSWLRVNNHNIVACLYQKRRQSYNIKQNITLSVVCMCLL